jgi:hypothetical protein
LTPLQDRIARLAAAERDRLRGAAERFEARAGEAVDALPVDAWIVRASTPPLLFAWPTDEVNTKEILHDVLIGVRPTEGLLLVPMGWLRIVSGVSDWRRRELEAAEALAKAFRNSLLRPEGDRS